MSKSIINRLVLVIAIFHCSTSAYPLVSRSGAIVVRYARQAGYVYDRPKIPFELSPPSTARPPPSTSQSGYAYTAGNTAEPVSIGYSKGSSASGGSSYATQSTGPTVTSTSYGNSQSKVTSSGSVSTGYNYATQTAVTQTTQVSSAGPSTNGPTYLPPSLSPSVSDNGDNGIVASSYSGTSTISTSASTTAAPVSPTEVYLPPNTVAPSPATPTPQTAPPNPQVNVYIPPSSSSTSLQGTPSISTPAPTYLPPFL